MKNRVLNSILSLLLVGSAWSCTDKFLVGNGFLEKAPGVDVTIDTIFSHAEYAREFLWRNYRNLYTGLPLGYHNYHGRMNGGCFELLSDCWQDHQNYDGVVTLYYNGAFEANYENTGHYARFSYHDEYCWEAVRASWIFIENIDRVPDMPVEEKERLKAEAKVIIASRYFDMVRHLGGVPIVDHAWGVNEDTENPRATILDTKDFMIRMIDEAIPHLPWALLPAEYQNWDGRITQAAAMGLKCKILLFIASPLFNDDVPYCSAPPQDAVTNRNVWTGGYLPELWEECLTACEAFFTAVDENGMYHLLQASGPDLPLTDPNNKYRVAFRDAYSQTGSGYDNPEMLLATRTEFTNLRRFRDTFVPGGGFTPTQEFVDMFPTSEGYPFDWNNQEHRAAAFTDRDPRLFETVVVNGTLLNNVPAQMWVGGRDMQNSSTTESGEYATGYGLFKYVIDDHINVNRIYTWPYLRMAEMHLIYAEALMMADRCGDAVAEVDKVRARVGLKGLEECNPGKDYTDRAVLLDEILRERACELALEDVRFFDLIRYKKVAEFTTPLHGLLLRRADGVEAPLASGEAFPTEYEYEFFELHTTPRHMWADGYEFDPKWYLTAFPPVEVNKGYGLVQNPGW